MAGGERNSDSAVSARNRVRRFGRRGRYDRETAYQILDAGFLCHIGFVSRGTPVVIPTLYWRDEDRVYFHGSRGSRMLKEIHDRDICLSVTHLDALCSQGLRFTIRRTIDPWQYLADPKLSSNLNFDCSSCKT